MRTWWPPPAQATWRTLSPGRKRRARAILHWMTCEFDGVVPDQTRLLTLLETKDGLPSGPVVETIRHLTRVGLLRRHRRGPRTRLWVPRELLFPPGDR